MPTNALELYHVVTTVGYDCRLRLFKSVAFTQIYERWLLAFLVDNFFTPQPHYKFIQGDIKSAQYC